MLTMLNSLSKRTKIIIGVAVAIIISITVWLLFFNKKTTPFVAYKEENVQKAVFSKALEVLINPAIEGFEMVPESEITPLEKDEKYKKIMDAASEATKALLTEEELKALCYPNPDNFAKKFANISNHCEIAIKKLDTMSSLTNTQLYAYATIGIFLATTSLKMTNNSISALKLKKNANGGIQSIIVSKDLTSIAFFSMFGENKIKSPFIKATMARLMPWMSQKDTGNSNYVTVDESTFVDILLCIVGGVLANPDIGKCITFSTSDSAPPSIPPTPTAPTYVPSPIYPDSMFAPVINALRAVNDVNIDTPAENFYIDYNQFGWMDMIPSSWKTSFNSIVGTGVTLPGVQNTQCLSSSDFKDQFINAYIRFLEGVYNVQTMDTITPDEFVKLATYCAMFMGLYGRKQLTIAQLDENSQTIMNPDSFLVDIVMSLIGNMMFRGKSALSNVTNSLDGNIKLFMIDYGLTNNMSSTEMKDTFNRKEIKTIPVQIVSVALINYATLNIMPDQGAPFPPCSNLLGFMGVPGYETPAE